MKSILTAALLGLSMTAFAHAADVHSPAFTQGVADRQAWETWFGDLDGQYKAGALFWASQRSLPHPIGCIAAGGRDLGDWSKGCIAAQQRLAPVDARRKIEPDYRLGWNSFNPTQAGAVSPAEPVQLAPPADAANASTSVPAAAAPPTAAAPQGALVVPPTAPAAVIGQWTGSAMMTTRPFLVDGPWELQWNSSEGYFSIHLVAPNGTETEIANQILPGHSSSYIARGGEYYLRIQGRAPWAIKAVNLRPTNTASVAIGAAAAPADAAPPIDGKASDRVESHRGGLPKDETAILQIVDAAISRYNSGQNEMQQGSARPMRAESFCRVLPGRHARSWVGAVYDLSTNGDGKGVLELQIAPKVYLGTMNNSLSDIGTGTLIDPQSQLFGAASQLHKGQKVLFTGEFIASDTDCFAEKSLTLRGSVTEPDFVMRFESVRPLD